MLYPKVLTDLERMQAYASFLGLPGVKELEKNAISHGIGSKSTFARIHRGDTDSREGKRVMAELARLISPHYLVTLSPEKQFLKPELTSRLLGVGNAAWHAWLSFLKGETNVALTMKSLEDEFAPSIELRPRGDREKQMKRLRQHIEEVQVDAVQAGAIKSPARSRAELLRWQWDSAHVDAALWLRLRTAWCLAQTRMEETAAVIYLAAPVIPLVLLPIRECHRQLIDSAQGDAASYIQRQSEEWWRRRKLPLTDGMEAHSQGPNDPMVHAENLLKAFGVRHRNFGARSGLRQVAVVALFSERRTREFFNAFGEEQKNVAGACERALAPLVRRGLVLLSADMTEDEAQTLSASLTVGGDTPGVVIADEIIPKSAKARDVVVARAGTSEYRRARERFDAVANRSTTRRLFASDIGDLVQPEEILEARRARARERWNYESAHYYDL